MTEMAELSSLRIHAYKTETIAIRIDYLTIY